MDKEGSGENNALFDSNSEESTSKKGEDAISSEDLGIIDLDSDGDDDFEEVDDESLPVLKNTYSKKTRPNNSKSVAIGSRSKGGIKLKAHGEGTPSPQKTDSKKFELEELEEEKVEMNAAENDSEEVSIPEDLGDDDSQTDQIYEAAQE